MPSSRATSLVVSMMKGIKSLLDPNDIMNPGKIWE
jgi:FAD/FMN-containing dehydrogenase